PLSRVIGIERCVLDPDPIAGRRPRIKHLKRITARTKRLRKYTLNCWTFGNRWRLLYTAYRFFPTDRRSEFLPGSCHRQRDQDCDHQCLHGSLSFEACEMLPITTPAHNISFDGFS